MTSISLQGEQLLEAVRASRPLTGRAAADPSGLAVLAAAGGALPEIVLPEELDLQPLRHLACAGDYALPFISPSRADGRGGTDLLSPVSAYTPRSEVLRGPRFPFWKIDVMPDQPRMPSGRRLRTTALLTGGG